MAVDKISQYIIDQGAQDALRSLPAHEHMQWRITKDLQEVLVIGGNHTQEILAFWEINADRTLQLKYYVQEIKLPDRLVDLNHTKILKRDAVERGALDDLRLNAPCSYTTSTDISQQGPSDLSVVIQWYFMGLRKICTPSYPQDYCARFLAALRKIESAATLDHQQRVDEGHEGETTLDWCTPTTIRSTGLRAEDRSIYMGLLESLDQNLLKLIPPATKMKFETLWRRDHSVLPQILLVGNQAGTKKGIYAQWRKWYRSQRIEFFVLVGDKQNMLNSAELPQHDILPPFDKTYPRRSKQLDPQDSHRFTTYIRWYFIAERHAEGQFVREDYAKCLRSPLSWI